jgi:hypothetical protein
MIHAADREALRRGIHAAIRSTFESVAGSSFVEKTPGVAAIDALPLVVEQWPQAKIVFAKRRGIENVISAVWKFPHWTFEAACRNWTAAMASWSSLDPDVKANAIEIDQAEMAHEPDATAARLGAFLGLSDAAAAGIGEAFGFRAHARTNTRVSSMDELRVESIPLDETPWTEEQRATFVALCSDMMRSYGYRLD